MLTLKTWLIILKMIQLVKQMLKKFKCIKRNKKAKIIKHKKRALGRKKLLNLFNNLLNIILTDKTLKS